MTLVYKNAALELKEAQLSQIIASKREHLKDLYYVTKDSNHPGRFLAGFPARLEGDEDEKPTASVEDGLKEFIERYESENFLESLPLCIPALSPSPPPRSPNLSDREVEVQDQQIDDVPITAHSSFHLKTMSDEYASNLPPLPLEVVRNRLGQAQSTGRKKPKDKQLPVPELYKMDFRAQHLGARALMGRGKRVHNVLTTQDWNVSWNETRALRVFERIEELKKANSWSFRQPKRQRTGAHQKAHWDHVIDEMKWLQNDFRQEGRWKKVVAYNLVHAVQDWHLATPEERHFLCVKTRPPTFLSGDGLQAKDNEMEVDASTENGVEEKQTAPRPTNEPPPEAAPTIQVPGSAVPATQAPNNSAVKAIVALRSPLFELGPHVTTVTTETLNESDLVLKMNRPFADLFPDLPAYSFVNDVNPADKRLEESSIWHSKITPVSNWSHSKPLLVSTLNPGKSKTTKGWKTSTAYEVDDSREYMAPADSPFSATHLFAGKRKEQEPVGRPPAPPDHATRAASLFWTSEEDSFLVQLHQQYGSHWSLIADQFNTLTARPRSDFRYPWDVYDRWSRLEGPASKKVLPDGTELEVPLPAFVPAPDRPIGAPSSYTHFNGVVKVQRRQGMLDIIRKEQRKREQEAIKKPAPGYPRRVNLMVHDSHLSTIGRPAMTPAEWSLAKAEHDAAVLLRLQHKQQQEAQRLLLQAQQQTMHSQASTVPPPLAAQSTPTQQPSPALSQAGHASSLAQPLGLPSHVVNTNGHNSPQTRSPQPSAPNFSPAPSMPNNLQINAAFAAQLNGMAPNSWNPEQIRIFNQHRQQVMQAQQAAHHAAQQPSNSTEEPLG